jgi:hypothetical protein
LRTPITARAIRGDERTRYLDERCRADAAMRRQVEALLAQDDTPDSFFNRPAVEVATESPRSPELT